MTRRHLTLETLISKQCVISPFNWFTMLLHTMSAVMNYLPDKRKIDIE